MDIAQLLDTYKNGRRVRSKPVTLDNCREGTIEGTSLGGATKRGTNRPMLNVHVKWDDGTESTTTHFALDVIDHKPRKEG